MPTRIPFHFGLFSNAMVGLIGRDPDDQTCLGFDGFYDFRYQPKNDTERKELRQYAEILAKWLDMFDIQFSGSRCEYGKATPIQPNSEDVLQVKISLPVKNKVDNQS